MIISKKYYYGVIVIVIVIGILIVSIVGFDYLLAQIDRNEAYQNIATMQHNLLLSISISILIIIGIAVSFSRTLIRQIKKLAKITGEIAAGNFDSEIDPKMKLSSNEVGKLALHLDKMREDVKMAHIELERSNNQLRLDRNALKKLAEAHEEHNIRLEQLNRELKTEQKKYQELYDESPDLYRTTDKNGIILNCNKAYTKSLGYKKDEVIGMSIFEHVAKESYEAMHQSFETWLRDGKVLNKEVFMKRKNGTTFPALVSATNLYDVNGSLIGSNTIIKDMSEIQHYRSEATQLRELDRTKGEFSSMVTHELKTPLVPILLYGELLLDGKLGDLTTKQKDKIRIIYDSAKSLSQLIQDVLDVHKLELSKMKFEIRDINAKELIDECIDRSKPLAQTKNVKITSNADGQVIIQCDPERILQVLNNLVSNAVKFVPEQDGKISIFAVQRDGLVEFEVQDNGIGIPNYKQKNLFKKFYQVDMSETRNSGGSGLGLAICKGIVEAHNGKVWFKSEEGKGTTFYFTIPITTKNEVVEKCQA